MSAIMKKKVYGPLDGGLNTKVSPIMLQPNEAAELVNYEVSERGILDKYKGYIKDHSPFPNNAASFLRLLINYRKGSTVDTLVMAAQDNGNTNATYKVDYKQTAGDGTSAYIGHTAGTDASFTNGNKAVTGTATTWLTQLKSGDKIKASAHADSVYAEIDTVNNDTSITLLANYTGATVANTAYIARIITHKDFIPRATIFNNKTIITNGNDSPMSFDNTTLNRITDTDCPKARYIEAHKNRIFMAGTSSYPSRLFWSAVNDETTWDAASEEDVFAQDNGSITAIKSFGDSLIVFKNNGRIFQMVGNFDQDAVGSPDFIRKIDVTENVGIISERSPVVHNGLLYFMTTTGLYTIDQRMFVQKFTYKLDNFMSTLNFTLGPNQSKSYTESSATEWNSGTLSGCYAVGGTLVTPFEEIVIDDVTNTTTNIRYVGYDSRGDTLPGTVFSTAIDSSNDIHIAYVTTGNNIVYKKYSASTGSITTTTTVYSGGDALFCSIGAGASSKVGIMFSKSSSYNNVYFTEDYGVTTYTFSATTTGENTPQIFDLKYSSGNLARALVGFSGKGGSIAYLAANSPSSWNYLPTTLGSGSVFIAIHASLSMCQAHNQVVIARLFQGDTTASGTVSLADEDTGSYSGTYTFHNSATNTVRPGDRAYAAWDANANKHHAMVRGGTGIGGGALFRADYEDSIVTVIDSGATSVYGAYVKTYNAHGDFIYHYATGTGATAQEKIRNADTSTTILNPSLQTSNVSALWGLAGNGASVYAGSGTIVAASCPGYSANTFKVTRLSVDSSYISAENSDSTLTAWSTFVVEQTTNNNTLTHYVALNTVSPATSYNAITNGQVISADSTKIFIKNKMIGVVSQWAGISVDSVSLNFFGAGVDSKQPVGYSHNTELYYAVAETSASNNNYIIKLDRNNKFIKLTHPVSVFERYKDKLYGGLATKGDLIILNQGYNAAGSAYSGDFQSKEDFLDSLELYKDIYKFYVLYEVKPTGTFDFSYRLDSFATYGGSAWTTQTVDQTADGIVEVPVGTKCRSLQFRCQNSGADQQSSVIAVVLIYGILNIR